MSGYDSNLPWQHASTSTLRRISIRDRWPHSQARLPRPSLDKLREQLDKVDEEVSNLQTMPEFLIQADEPGWGVWWLSAILEGALSSVVHANKLSMNIHSQDSEFTSGIRSPPFSYPVRVSVSSSDILAAPTTYTFGNHKTIMTSQQRAYWLLTKDWDTASGDELIYYMSLFVNAFTDSIDSIWSQLYVKSRESGRKQYGYNISIEGLNKELGMPSDQARLLNDDFVDLFWNQVVRESDRERAQDYGYNVSIERLNKELAELDA